MKNFIILNDHKIKNLIKLIFCITIFYFFILFIIEKIKISTFLYLSYLFFVNYFLFYLYLSSNKEKNYFPIYPLIIFYYLLCYSCYFYIDQRLFFEETLELLPYLILIISLGIISFSVGYFAPNYLNSKKKIYAFKIVNRYEYLLISFFIIILIFYYINYPNRFLTSNILQQLKEPLILFLLAYFQIKYLDTKKNSFLILNIFLLLFFFTIELSFGSIAFPFLLIGFVISINYYKLKKINIITISLVFISIYMVHSFKEDLRKVTWKITKTNIKEVNLNKQNNQSSLDLLNKKLASLDLLNKKLEPITLELNKQKKENPELENKYNLEFSKSKRETFQFKKKLVENIIKFNKDKQNNQSSLDLLNKKLEPITLELNKQKKENPELENKYNLEFSKSKRETFQFKKKLVENIIKFNKDKFDHEYYDVVTNTYKKVTADSIIDTTRNEIVENVIDLFSIINTNLFSQKNNDDNWFNSSLKKTYVVKYQKVRFFHSNISLQAVIGQTPKVHPASTALSRFKFYRDVDFFNGKSYVHLHKKFLPRFINKNKPREEWGNFWGKRYGILDSKDNITSWNFPILNEFFANYGLKGVVIGMFLFGMFIKTLMITLLINSSNAAVCSGVCVIIFNFFYQENNLSFLLGVIISYSTLFGLILISILIANYFIERIMLLKK